MGGLTIARQVYDVVHNSDMIISAYLPHVTVKNVACGFSVVYFVLGTALRPNNLRVLTGHHRPNFRHVLTSYMFVCTQSTVDMSDSVMVAVIIKLKRYISSGLKLSCQSSTR